MQQSSFNMIHSLFDRAIAIDDSCRRREYLDRACGDDAELKAAVIHLLEAYTQSDTIVNPDFAFHLAADSRNESSLDVESEFAAGFMLDSFRLECEIGCGGYGVVFQAQQLEPVRRKVAIKLIKPGMDSKNVIKRFEHERQALAMMNHESIAQIYDAGTTPLGRPYFAMELVDGLPITKFCDDHRLTLVERLELMAQVCEGVQHAHQRGLIHRDLKPNNILVQTNNGKHVPKVIDFGIAKSLEQKLSDDTLQTYGWQMLGTPLYMSPEQAQFGPTDIDVRSDVYSLGIVLFEILSGSTPVRSAELSDSTPNELSKRIERAASLIPSQRVRELQTRPRHESANVAQARNTTLDRLTETLRGDLDCIVAKAINFDREDRYESVGSLVRDLKNYLTGEPVEARPYSKIYLFQKFARKNSGFVTSVAAISAVLAIATTISVWAAFSAIESEKVSMVAIEKQRQALEAEKIAKNKAIAAKEDAVNARNVSAQKAEQLRQVFELQSELYEESTQYFRGRNVTFEQVLDRNARALENHDGDPRIGAYLSLILGRSYQNIYMYVEAQELFENAYILARQNSDDDLDRLSLDIEYYLALNLRLLNQPEKARTRIESVILREEQIEVDSQLLRARLLLGACNHDLNDFTRAEAAYRAALSANILLNGKAHVLSIMTMTHLANLKHERGQTLFALDLRNKAFEISKRTTGLSKYRELELRAALQHSYAEFGLREKALQAAEENVQLGRRYLTEQHPEFYILLKSLAESQANCGLVPESISTYEEVQQVMDNSPSPAKRHRARQQLMKLSLVAQYLKNEETERAAELIKNVPAIYKSIAVARNTSVSQSRGWASTQWLQIVISEKRGDLEKARQIATDFKTDFAVVRSVFADRLKTLATTCNFIWRTTPKDNLRLKQIVFDCEIPELLFDQRLHYYSQLHNDLRSTPGSMDIKKIVLDSILSDLQSMVGEYEFTLEPQLKTDYDPRPRYEKLIESVATTREALEFH